MCTSPPCLESFHALPDIEGDISRFQCPRCFANHQTSGRRPYRVFVRLLIVCFSLYLIFVIQGLDASEVAGAPLGRVGYITEDWREDTASLLIVHFRLKGQRDRGSSARVVYESLRANYSQAIEATGEMAGLEVEDGLHTLCFWDVTFDISSQADRISHKETMQSGIARFAGYV